MTDEEFENLFNTFSFNRDPIKETIRINENVLYIVSFNGPDLIFEFHSMSDWSLITATSLIRKE